MIDEVLRFSSEIRVRLKWEFPGTSVTCWPIDEMWVRFSTIPSTQFSILKLGLEWLTTASHRIWASDCRFNKRTCCLLKGKRISLAAFGTAALDRCYCFYAMCMHVYVGILCRMEEAEERLFSSKCTCFVEKLLLNPPAKKKKKIK